MKKFIKFDKDDTSYNAISYGATALFCIAVIIILIEAIGG